MQEQETFETALDELLAEVRQGRDVTERLRQMRLVYADWLDERGDRAGAAQRWMAREGKHPRHTGTSWAWWPFGDSPDSKAEDLPAAIFDRLPGRSVESTPLCKEYPSRASAERALFKALLLLDLLPS